MRFEDIKFYKSKKVQKAITDTSFHNCESVLRKIDLYLVSYYFLKLFQEKKYL